MMMRISKSVSAARSARGEKEDFASRRRRRIKTRAMSSSSSNNNVRNPHRAKPNVQYSTVELTSEYVLEKNFHPSYDHRNDPLRENDSRLNSLAFHHKNLEDVIALSEDEREEHGGADDDAGDFPGFVRRDEGDAVPDGDLRSGRSARMRGLHGWVLSRVRQKISPEKGWLWP